MSEAVDSIIKKVGPKSKALLRTAPYYSVEALLTGYKSHILCLLEGATGAIYHASDSILSRLDRVQVNFFRKVGLDCQTAFLEHNLAPLGLRRDIAMLGLIFKCVKGLAHPSLCSLFPVQDAPLHRYQTRLADARHNFQLRDRTEHISLSSFHRSIFGLVRVWNILPPECM
jgi:hypothetical protein